MMRLPHQVKLNGKRDTLIIIYDDNQQYALPAEYLRVYSPSATVRGHGNPIIQTHKKYVLITSIEPTGNYALKIAFSDGHDSGLYHWDYLEELAVNFSTKWNEYLAILTENNLTRE